jgi:hypothetical protein
MSRITRPTGWIVRVLADGNPNTRRTERSRINPLERMQILGSIPTASASRIAKTMSGKKNRGRTPTVDS